MSGTAVLATTSLLALGFLNAAPASAATIATVTALGDLGGGYSQAVAINDSGQVAGVGVTAAHETHGFIWDATNGMSDLGTLPGDDYISPTAINNGGRVVGNMFDTSNYVSKGFTWTAAGGLVDIGNAGPDGTTVQAVNDAGQIVANSSVYDAATDSYSDHGFVWNDGHITPVGTPDESTYAYGENASGEVVGDIRAPDFTSQGFTRTAEGDIVNLDPLPGNNSSVPLGIADDGLVAGLSYTQTGDVNGTSDLHSVVWTPQGQIIDISAPGGVPLTFTRISATGEIVGGYQTSTGAAHAFSWTLDGGLVDLGTLAGDSESSAVSVNSHGEVIGTSDNQGETPRAFSWTPSGGMLDLGPLPPRGVVEIPKAINDAGQVVGASNTDQSSSVAVIWNNTVALPPSITSPNSATAEYRTSFDFQVTTSGYPAPAVTEAGTLPSGINFQDGGYGTGYLYGTPDTGTAGSYPISFTVTNGAGAGSTQQFTLTVSGAASTPQFTSNSDYETAGYAFSTTVGTTGYPIPKITKTGSLPAGVSFVDNKDGTATLSGPAKTTAAGPHQFTLTAKNSAGSTSETFTFTVATPPTIKKVPATTLTVAGATANLTITTTGYPAPSLRQTGFLPSGLTFADQGNGTAVISGTPSPGSGGVYSFPVIARNGSGSDTQTVQLTVREAPTFFGDPTGAGTVGAALEIPVSAGGYPAPKITESGTLPKGVTFTSATSEFTGTPKAKTAGTYTVTLTAKNAVATTTEQFTLNVS